jgi:hypothetical protein
LPLVEIPVITTAADGRGLEVLDTISSQISKDLLIGSVKPEAGASRLFGRREFMLKCSLNSWVRLQKHVAFLRNSSFLLSL